MPDHPSPIGTRRLRLPGIFIVSLLLLQPAGIRAQSVAVQEGKVVYRASAHAAPRWLTSGGLDSEAVLAPDGRRIAFIRRIPGDSVESATGPEEATSLWIMRVDGGDARMLVRARSADDPRRTLSGFQHPRFSPDGRRIYFLSSAWVTSAAVHAVEVDSGSERFIAPGNSLEVVPSGEFAGHLIVSQHRYFDAGGSYDWYRETHVTP
jgi:dipeptidyl aminopeptidase/acylaminoacyl peptidase